VCAVKNRPLAALPPSHNQTDGFRLKGSARYSQVNLLVATVKINRGGLPLLRAQDTVPRDTVLSEKYMLSDDSVEGGEMRGALQGSSRGFY